MAIISSDYKLTHNTLLIIGLSFIFLSYSGYFTFPKYYNYKLKYHMILKNDSSSLSFWAESPIPTFVSFYLFNVTNYDSVQSYGEKPCLEEIGPYVFEEISKKKILGWDNKKGSIYYENSRRLTFVPTLSLDNLNNTIFTTNLRLLYLNRLILERQFDDQYYSFINDSIDEDIFVQETIQEALTFSTIDDDTDDLDNLYIGKIDSLSEYSSEMITYSIFTGAKDFTKLAMFETISNKTKLNVWGDAYCNMLNGTDGRQFPFPVNMYDNLYMYLPDLVRSVTLSFCKEIVIEDLMAYRYDLSNENFASIPKNRGFCFKKGICPPSGVHEVAISRNGPPLLFSFPHFYGADPIYLNAVDGLSPSYKLHQSILDVEPLTGITLQYRNRMMINAVIKPNMDIPSLRKISSVILPILWVDHNFRVTPEMSHTLQIRFFNVIYATRYFIKMLFWAGIALLGFVFFTSTTFRKSIDIPKRRDFVNPLYKTIDF